MTLHIVCEFKGKSRIERYWQECFRDKDFENYSVNIIEGTVINHDSLFFSKSWYDHIQSKIIIDLVRDNKVQKGDVFIFANAFNFLIPQLRYFVDEFQLGIKLIGFWSNSLAFKEAPIYSKFKASEFKWEQKYERLLYEAYDVNCFFNESQADSFFKGRKRTGNYRITGHPFEYLTRDIQEDEKDDIILFPFEVKNDTQTTLFKGITFELKKKFQFISVQSKTFNERTKFQDLLKISKGIFCASYTEYDPVLIYEAMLNGVAPIVPDNFIYQDIIPQEYQYPRQLIVEKNMKLLRHKFQVADEVLSIIDNYDHDVVRTQAKIIGEKYYSNQPFLKVLHEFN